MNFRLSAALFTAILVLVAVLLVRSFVAEKHETGSLLPGLDTVKADQIDSVELERQDSTDILKLERKGKDQWVITAPIHATADAILVKSVIEAVLKAKPTVFAERLPALSVTGLQPPSLKITLRQGNERSGTLNLGNITYGKASDVFVSTPERPDRAIAINRNELDPLFKDSTSSGKAGDLAKWTADYRSKLIFPSDAMMSGEEVTALKLSLQNKKKELVLSRQGGGWKFDFPTGWGEADTFGDLGAAPKTITGVRPLLGAINSIKATSSADFVDKQGDLSTYGLNPENPDLIRVEMTTKDASAVVFLGKIEAGGPPGPNGLATTKVWVRIEGQPGVIHASCSDLSGLVSIIENPDPLRNRNLLEAKIDQIEGIDLTSHGQTAKLRKMGPLKEWKLVGKPEAGDPQNPNLALVNNILQTLTKDHTIKSFPPVNAANFAPPEIKAEVKVWSEGFEPAADLKAEPKEKGKPTILLFGKREGDSIFVRRTTPDGSVSEVVIPDHILVKSLGGGPDQTFDVLAEVSKNRLDLLNPDLKRFAPTIVNKVTVTGLRTWAVQKEEPKEFSPYGDRWVFLEPSDKKGTTADNERVMEIINLLANTTSVTRFIDDAPSEEKLIEYGLAAPKMPPKDYPPSPRLKLVIGLKGTDLSESERVLEFGNTVGDMVYARQPGRSAVFTLPKSLFDAYTNTDLRDRAIFQFDPAKITGLEFEGWKSITGTNMKLKIEKGKDGVWKATEPAGFDVNPAKVEDFLRTLRMTRAKAFLSGPPTPEQGFADEKTRLKIVLKTEAGPIMTLVLGNPVDNGASYFLLCSTPPQSTPVVTVDSIRFKVFKDSPGSFSK